VLTVFVQYCDMSSGCVVLWAGIYYAGNTLHTLPTPHTLHCCCVFISTPSSNRQPSHMCLTLHLHYHFVHYYLVGDSLFVTFIFGPIAILMNWVSMVYVYVTGLLVAWPSCVYEHVIAFYSLCQYAACEQKACPCGFIPFTLIL